MMNIDSLNKINSKADFILLVDALVNDLRKNPGGWENNSIESYLKAIAGWTEDMDGFYANNNLEVPQNVDWKFFAFVLTAAKMYE